MITDALGTPAEPEWWGGVLFVGAMAAGLSAPLLALIGMGASWRIGVDPAESAAPVAAGQLQVRAAEEPYLLRTHGDDAARTGRFVPGIGRLPPAADDPRIAA